MRALRVLLALAVTFLTATHVAATQGPGDPSSPPPNNRPPTRAGYRDIFPVWLQEDIFGNYDACVNRVAPSLARSRHPDDEQAREAYLQELLSQCAEARDQHIAQWMKNIREGRPPRPDDEYDLGLGGPSQFSNPPVRNPNIFQSVGDGLRRYGIIPGNRKTAPRIRGRMGRPGFGLR